MASSFAANIPSIVSSSTFFCYAHNLAIEIDGDTHYQTDQQEYDRARTDWLAQYGIRVIRFTNRDVESNIEGVLDEIARACGIDAHFSPGGGELKGGASCHEETETLPPL